MTLCFKVASIAALVFLIGPLLVIVPISFSSAQYLTFPPPGLSLQWYVRFLGTPQWIDSIWVSLQVASISAVLAGTLGTMASIGLVRGRFRGKMMAYGLILAPMIVPVIITGVADYFFFSRLGMSGTVAAIALGHTVVVLPMVVVIVSATLQGFDERLEQAAISLGASRWCAFRRVTLPIIAPGLVTAALFAFLASFDELVIPLFLGGTRAQTLAVRIWNSMLLEIEPTIAAVSTFLMLVSIAVLTVVFLMRRMRA